MVVVFVVVGCCVEVVFVVVVVGLTVDVLCVVDVVGCCVEVVETLVLVGGVVVVNSCVDNVVEDVEVVLGVVVEIVVGRGADVERGVVCCSVVDDTVVDVVGVEDGLEASVITVVGLVDLLDVPVIFVVIFAEVGTVVVVVGGNFVVTRSVPKMFKWQVQRVLQSNEPRRERTWASCSKHFSPKRRR